MEKHIQKLCCLPTTSLHDAMIIISQYSKGIVLVTDQDEKLLFTVTDGDIRRAILSGQKLDAPVQTLLAYKPPEYLQPVTAPVGTDPAEMVRLMQEREVLQLPLLDSSGRVTDLVLLDDFVPEESSLLHAVVIAGGFGKRLMPLTEHTPKPMLPVGDRPLLARIVNGLRTSGIRRVNITTYYHPEKITEYFGNGEDFGVDIDYISEPAPMGTAGALGLMERPNEPFLVINGDILTQVDFQAMFAFHRERKADFTVAVRQYSVQLPYGVIDIEDSYVKGLSEKPTLSFFVNAGIYLLEPHVYDYIPPQQRFDMTDLIEKLVANGSKVASFPIVEYWLDIGQHADYVKAQDDIMKGVLPS